MSSAGQEDSEATAEPAAAAPEEAKPVDVVEPAASEETSEGAAGIKLRFAGRTAVGLVREHNEDNFVIANLTTAELKPRDTVCDDSVGERGSLFAVCDGMGGAAAGEVASQMAVDILYEALRRGGVPTDRDALARRLVSAVEEAGRRIFDSAQKERSRRGMGTTATVAVLVDKVLFVAEVGDSRAYLLRRGELKQITKDQSLVNQLIEAGHLTEDEAEAFEHSNIILQALGTSESVQVDLTFVELRRGDRLMMCSDGLSGLVHHDTLREVLTELDDPAECCGKLIEYAEGGGGHDNITVIVADFDGDELTEPKESDSVGYVQYPLPLEVGESGAFADEDTTASGADHPKLEEDPGSTPTVPAAPPNAETSGGGALWLVSGVVALVAAVAVWAVADPKRGQPEEVAEPTVMPAPSVEPPPEPEPVLVNIHTDVEQATLVVNGESRGPLTAEQSKSLELAPGAYRFEAHGTDGSQAVSVVTVRGDTPMDVFLKLPLGSTGATPLGGPEDGLDEGEPGDETEAAPEEVAAEPVRPRKRPRVRARSAPTAPAPEPAPAPSTSPRTEAEPVAATPGPPAAAPAPKPPGAKPAPKPAPATPPPAPAAPADPIPENPF